MTIKPVTVQATPIANEQSSNYSREELNMQNINSLDDLSSVIPSFFISNYGSRDVAFTTYRGQTNSMSTASPIAVYIDDIPLSFVNTFLTNGLYNISEVSVLKGPQGFSTGLGAEAGIIELKMDNRFVKKEQISAQIGAANYNEKSIALHSKTPLKNGLLSVDGLYNKRDGFTKNSYNNSTIDGEETKAASVRMIKDIGAFRVTLLGMNDVDDDGGVPFNNNLATPFVMNQNINGYVKQNSLLGSIKLEYFGDDFSLKSVTSLQNHHTKELLDGDRTVQNLLIVHTNENFKEFNEELGYTIQKHDWKLTGGAFYADQYEHTYMENHQYEYLGTSGYQEWQKSMPEKNFALFCEYSTYLSDDLVMSAGLRYIWSQKNFDSTITTSFPIQIPAYGFVNTLYPHAVLSRTWQRVLPKLKLTYKTTPKSSLYVQYAQGFKNGGYNYADNNPNAVTYDPEDSKTYEIGFNYKSKKSLYFSTSLYATYVKNLQVETIRPDITSYVDNAAKAEIYGFESELHYALTDGFKIYSSIGLVQAKFKDYISNNVDYSGNKLLNVPEYTCELGSEYDFMKKYYFYTALKSNGKTYFDKANSVSQSPYAYVNAKIGFRSKKLLWSIYARNIFDKRYLNYVVSAGGLNAYNFGEPRRFGASLTYNF